MTTNNNCMLINVGSILPYFGKKGASDIPSKYELLIFSYFT